MFLDLALQKKQQRITWSYYEMFHDKLCCIEFCVDLVL